MYIVGGHFKENLHAIVILVAVVNKKKAKARINIKNGSFSVVYKHLNPESIWFELEKLRPLRRNKNLWCASPH